MKRLKHILTVVMLLCAAVASAETVVVDGITYNVVKEEKQAQVIAGETKYTGKVVIPETIEYDGVTCSVTSIEDYAFNGCSGLTSVIIPNSVTSIGGAAFFRCSGLISVVIPNSVTSIGDAAFDGCSGLTSIVIPNSVTSIGDYAFYNCSGLTSVVIPKSVTTIERSAFEDCSGLTSVVIPKSVTSIGDWAFSSCSGLETVTIGSGVKNVGSGTFAKCENLTDVYCLATAVPSTGSNAFYESYPEHMTLHVPAESIDSYRSTEPWSSFGTIVTLEGGSGETGVIEVETVPELVTCKDGTISISGGEDGADVAVYTAGGAAVGTAVIANGCAVVSTSLAKGDIAVVSIAGKGIKVVMQ